MSPGKRRPQGSGGLYQRHEAAYGCPPLVEEVGADGKVRKVRPPHTCHGLHIGTVNVGYNRDGNPRRKTVSSKDPAVAQAKLDALILERDAQRAGLPRDQGEAILEAVVELHHKIRSILGPSSYPEGTESVVEPRRK